MGMEKVKPDVNGGAGGDRWAGREIVKLAAKKIRRRVSKKLIQEQSVAPTSNKRGQE